MRVHSSTIAKKASAVMGSDMIQGAQGNCLADVTFKVFAVSGVVSPQQDHVNIGLHDGRGVVVAVQPSPRGIL